MSVPLPLASPLPSGGPKVSSAKPIPQNGLAVPDKNDLAGASPSYRQTGFAPSSASARAGAGFASSPADSENWRERGSGARRTSVVVGVSGSVSKGPERTVGGFEKKDAAAAQGAGKDQNGAKKDSKAVGPNGSGESKASLSHVPCRFYKQGACTAGASCPFSHEDGGKKETCQWFLKGNCKFGHKCALLHVRPGEPLSMDRKNKKAQQQADAKNGMAGTAGSGSPAAPSTLEAHRPSPIQLKDQHSEEVAAPVPIRSALSSSLQASQPTSRMGSSPLREPFGPPSGALAGSPATAGFLGRSPGNFAASPSRPSPLSASFSARSSVPGPLSLKASAATPIHSQLRPPVTAHAASMISSSFSHSSGAIGSERPSNAPPMSASFADGSTLRRSIWARSETPDEPLSPRRDVLRRVSQRQDVFEDDDDDDSPHLIPSSLTGLLTANEKARRLSRRDSQDSYGMSPQERRAALGLPPVAALSPPAIGERLAQSASATMGPAGGGGNFLQSLWGPQGEDARRSAASGGGGPSTGDFAFGPATAAPQPRQSLLSQQRSPVPMSAGVPGTQQRGFAPGPSSGGTPGYGLGQSPSSASPGASRWQMAEPDSAPYFSRAHDPSSASHRALQEHAPGQSLPGGVATALSRLHLQGPGPSPYGSAAGPIGGQRTPTGVQQVPPPAGTSPQPLPLDHDHDVDFSLGTGKHHPGGSKVDEVEEDLFAFEK